MRDIGKFLKLHLGQATVFISGKFNELVRHSDGTVDHQFSSELFRYPFLITETVTKIDVAGKNC